MILQLVPTVHATASTGGFPVALLGPMRTPKAAASTNSEHNDDIRGVKEAFQAAAPE